MSVLNYIGASEIVRYHQLLVYSQADLDKYKWPASLNFHGLVYYDHPVPPK